MSDDQQKEITNLPEPVARKEAEQAGWLSAINPTNAAKVVRAIGRLVGTASKVSNTVAQKVRENKGRDVVSAAIANRIATGISEQDPQFERAFQREAARLLGEQQSLDDIAEIAMEEIGSKSEKDFQGGEVEDEWLYQFEQAAKGFTSDRMKHTFARLLAGEILRPGSFSPSTLRAVATMSTQDAAIIVRFLSLSYSPVIGPGRNPLSPQLLTAGASPGNNGLRPFGLSYSDLSTLQQCGFLMHDLTTNRTLNETVLLNLNSRIGSQIVRFIGTGDQPRPENITIEGLLLTNVGAEIAEIVEQKAPPEEYLVALKAHMENTHRISMLRLDS